MPWFKVDDKLHSHKKVLRAGVDALGLWVLAGSWCMDQLTDGFIPDYVALRLDVAARERAERLVAAGLWEVAEHDGDNGWQFHDWGGYQPTREGVETKREYERDKKRAQRRGPSGQFEASPGESPRDTEGTTEGVPRGVPPSRPVPTRPDPSSSSARSEAALGLVVSPKDDDKGSRRKPERPLPDTWTPTAKHHEYALERGVDIAEAVESFRNHAATHDRRARDWNAAFRTWLSKSRPTQRTSGTPFSLWDYRPGASA